MSRKTYRAGAIASALTLIVTLYGVTGSGALAQSDLISPEDSAASAPRIELPTFEPAAETLPRFVAEPVVQALPEPQEEPASAEAESLRELVADLSEGAPMPRDLRCLAQAIYFEARGEPLEGQLAVARVIVNRTQSPLFPGDYCSVVAQRGQFSFVKNGRIPEAPQGARTWRRAQAVARIAHQELWESEAQDALFFHATYARPGWARRKLARATIDSHVFYR